MPKRLDSTSAKPLRDPRGRPAAQLTTLSYDYVDGHVVPRHVHDEDQVVFAARGVMTIGTSQGLWVVPPLRAVWIPGNEAHSIAMTGEVRMRTLYFAPGCARGLARACFVLGVSPLLRELIVHACARKAWTTAVASERRVIELLLDLLVAAETVPLELPQPVDARAARVGRALRADPSDVRTLDELCRGVGASKRTIERAFVDETGMTFGKWRQQLRLLHAMRLLARGEKVTSVALEAGYDSTSAFIAAFRKALGCTPGRYFAAR
jgi:AraC-like DNA-binding protein/quercetin dioxygenase-like cupin family protein